MKRILGLCLSVLLLITVIPKATLAAEYVQVNNVINPGFEELFFGNLRGWTLARGEITLETVDTHSGSGALRLSGVAIAAQSIFGVRGGTVYIISAYVKATGGSTLGDVVYCKAECNTGYEDNLLKGNYSAALTGDWQQLSITFTPPSDVTSFSLLLRTKKGTAIWDDVSVSGQFQKEYDVTDPTPASKPALLAPMIGTELFDNNGFESGLNRDMWFTSDDFMSGGYISVSNVTRPESTGTKSIRIASNKSNHPHIYSNPSVNVEGNTRYQLSFWYKTDCKFLSVKLEYKNGASFGYRETKLPYASRTYGNGWAQYAVVIQTPPEATHITIAPRLYGTGEVWIDDISFYKIPQPRLFLETDRVFYYRDREEPGSAVISFNTAQYDDMEQYNVTLQICDGSIVRYTSETCPAAESVTFTFDTKLLETLGKDYTVEVFLSLKNGGQEKERQKQTVSRWYRPARLSKDGRLMENGKEFTPVIAYNVPESLYSEIGKAGINTVRIGLSDAKSTLNTLEAAKAAGLKVLACAYANMRPTAHPDNQSLYGETIRAISGHEALMAYVLLDEPQANLHPLEDMLYDSYRLVRENDAFTPVMLVEAPVMYAAYENTSKYCDILAVDPYTESHADVLDYTAEHIEKAFTATHYKMPVVSLFRTYGTTSNFPKIDELRYQVYNAMMHGVMGYGYFDVEKAYNNTTNLTDTPLWEEMKLAFENEYKDATAAFLEGKYPIYSEMQTESYHAKSYVKDGKIYLIALNRTTVPKTVTIPLSSCDQNLSVQGFTALVTGGDIPEVTGSGSISYTLPAMGAVRFEITPQNVMDFSALSAETFVDLNGYGWAREQIEDIARHGLMKEKTYQSFAPGELVTEKDGDSLLEKVTGQKLASAQENTILSREKWKAMCTEVIQKVCENNPAIRSLEIDITKALEFAKVQSGKYAVSRAEAAYIAARLLEWNDADWRLYPPLGVTFYSGGREITSLPNGKSEVKVSAAVRRKAAGGTDNAVVLVGLYSGNELLSIEFLTVEEINDEINKAETMLSVQKGQTVKSFLRSRTSLLSPEDWVVELK